MRGIVLPLKRVATGEYHGEQWFGSGWFTNAHLGDFWLKQNLS